MEVVPARRIIQKVFEEHIVHAPGMQKIRSLVDGPIIPTPGAVMEASRLLKEKIGDLITFDVGGATTDVHSVTDGSEEISRIQLSPEPDAKRTVEGDLGVYINRMNVLETMDKSKTAALCSIPEKELTDAVKKLKAVPESDRDKLLVSLLTYTALETALHRHAGQFRESFTARGKRTMAEGRDLTAVSCLIGTGGALTRLEDGADLLRRVFREGKRNDLLPQHVPAVFIDRSYILASLGVMSKKYPEDTEALLNRYVVKESERSDCHGRS